MMGRLFGRRFLAVLCVSLGFVLCVPQTSTAGGFIFLKKLLGLGGDEEAEAIPPEKMLALTFYRQKLDIAVRNDYSTVDLLQIYQNHEPSDLEGDYQFRMNEGGNITAFATWDSDIRLEGKIVEKERARRIYESLVSKKIDPGLLEHSDRNEFRARIFPIPAYGTKRLEMTYEEDLPVVDNHVKLLYTFNDTDVTDSKRFPGTDLFDLRLTIKSDYPIKQLILPKGTFGLKTVKQDRQNYEGIVHLENKKLMEDFVVEYELDPSGQECKVLTYQDSGEDGYFLVSAIPQGPKEGLAQAGRDVQILILFDSSISMADYGINLAVETLEKFFQEILKYAGSDLAKDSKVTFNLATLNDQLQFQNKSFVPLTRENVSSAVNYVLTSNIAGGTDISGGLKKAIQTFGKDKATHVVFLVTDSEQTVGDLDYKKMEESVHKANDRTVRVYGAIVPGHLKEGYGFVRKIAQDNGGDVLLVNGSNDIQFGYFDLNKKIQSTLLTVEDTAIRGVPTYDVFPKKFSDIPLKSKKIMVGRYKGAGEVGVKLTGHLGGKFYQNNAVAKTGSSGNGFIARLWARKKIDELLERIRYEGETEELINQIIALSKKYVFATPYTSFLAVPRSVLRPRVIKPGDPVLKISAPFHTRRVVVVLPFGETKVTHFDTESKSWQCRFLVPKGTPDGKYACDILITMGDGKTYREKKNFWIDSQPPLIKPEIKPAMAKAGEEIVLRARGAQDILRFYADVEGIGKVALRYNTETGYSIARFRLPDGMLPGKKSVLFHATDFALNETGERMSLEVVQ